MDTEEKSPEQAEKEKIKVQVVEEVSEPEKVSSETLSLKESIEAKPLITPVTEGDLVSGGSSSKTPMILTFIIGLVIGLLIGGGGMYFKFNSSLESTPTPEPVVSTPSPTPSPTPEPAVDVSLLKIQVLNGSGKAGEANKVKALLEKAGFKSVVVDNAKKYDYAATEVSLKASGPAKIYTLIYEALKAEYKLKESVEQLTSESKFDAVITVGTEKPAN